MCMLCLSNPSSVARRKAEWKKQPGPTAYLLDQHLVPLLQPLICGGVGPNLDARMNATRQCQEEK